MPYSDGVCCVLIAYSPPLLTRLVDSHYAINGWKKSDQR